MYPSKEGDVLVLIRPKEKSTSNLVKDVPVGEETAGDTAPAVAGFVASAVGSCGTSSEFTCTHDDCVEESFVD